jgi:hypothetical protein
MDVDRMFKKAVTRRRYNSIKEQTKRRPYKYSLEKFDRFLKKVKEFYDKNGEAPVLDLEDLRGYFGTPREPSHTIPVQASNYLKDYGIKLKKIRRTDKVVVLLNEKKK